MAHHRPIARGVSSLPSEAREEAHAAGASGLRATWDAASTASLAQRCVLAPAARGSSLDYFGDSSRRERERGGTGCFTLEADPPRNKVALLYSYP
jgi:hypothetical protein